MIVQPLNEARVLRQRVQQRTVEQVVDLRVPPAPTGLVEQMVDVPVPGRSSSVVSERIAEQVMDVTVSRGAHLRRAHVQQSTSSSAAALDASQGRKQGVFRTFSPGRKSAKVARQSTPELVRHPSSWTPAAYEHGDVNFWISPAGAFWQRFYDQKYARYYWTLGEGYPSQWHPPWED